MTDQTQVLLLSGIHGDEYGVISSIQQYFKTHKSNLPSYVFIPEVSPSAVWCKTRNNKFNKDLNRSFFDNSTDEEIIALKKKIKGISFSSVFTFHEDCDRKHEFYMYSSHNIKPQIFLNLKKQLKTIHITLFNGIDDPADPVLNNIINNGIHVSPIEKEGKETLWPWLHKNINVNYCIDFEIPMKASQETKDKIVQVLLDFLVFDNQNLFL